ncbi:unnamed protein product [Leuciscus chuanchicus]
MEIDDVQSGGRVQEGLLRDTGKQPLGLTLTFVAQGHDLMLEEKEPANPTGLNRTTGKISVNLSSTTGAKGVGHHTSISTNKGRQLLKSMNKTDIEDIVE